MKKDINKEIFPEETRLKLSIFAECFREWFPVFLHTPAVHGIHIYDFFAGSGCDAAGNNGSPLILLDEAKGDAGQHCRIQGKPVEFHFNEGETQKANELKSNVEKFLKKCSETHCKNPCRYSLPTFTKEAFKDIFSNVSFQAILRNEKQAKFILLDQYGFKEVDESIFKILIKSPMTDFIFFISSSFISRFKDHPATKRYFKTHQIPFAEKESKECHRQIADYYQSLIPNNQEYYIHNFTIKKGSNYWGLIFGSAHSLGMEKFLKVCWGKDEHSGEANFNIDDDWDNDSLFHTKGQSNKRQEVSKKIETEILQGRITSNRAGLKFALKNRCLPSLFIEVVKKLQKDGVVKLDSSDGKPSFAATNIHSVKPFQITIVKRYA